MYPTRFQLDPADAARLSADRVSVGGQLGAMFQIEPDPRTVADRDASLWDRASWVSSRPDGRSGARAAGTPNCRLMRGGAACAVGSRMLHTSPSDDLTWKDLFGSPREATRTKPAKRRRSRATTKPLPGVRVLVAGPRATEVGAVTRTFLHAGARVRGVTTLNELARAASDGAWTCLVIDLAWRDEAAALLAAAEVVAPCEHYAAGARDPRLAHPLPFALAEAKAIIDRARARG